MSKRNSRNLVASIILCAWPMSAMAQDSSDSFMIGEETEKKQVPITTSSVEVGFGRTNSDSFKFREYTGYGEDNFFAIGNIYLNQQAPYDGDSTKNWEIIGTNLGLSSRSVHAEYGHQGSFSLFGEFDQIPHFRFDDGETPYLGVGSMNLTLPSNWVPADDAPTLTNLDPNLRGVDIETERLRYGGGFSWNVSRDWEVSGSYHREDKDGLETIAGIFGTSGGNMRAAILPRPVDYTTQEADLTLTYNRPMFQGQLNYHLSLFNDNEDSLIWANPYTAQAAWDNSQDFNNGGLGRMALEPDNTAHQISASGSYLISPMTSVTGSFSYGRMFQDDDFLPYTINSSLTAADGVSSPVPLPRNSLDGDVTTLHGTLALASHPLPKTDVNARYTFDMRDNNTPRDVYLTIPNDTGDDTGDQAALNEDRARINRPYSRTSHKVSLDAGYRVLSSTRVGVGYDFETINRDFTEVEDTDEHTGRVKVRSTPVPYVSGWAEYDYAVRSGSDYVSNQPFLDSHTNELIADLTANDPDDLFENNPFLRKYYIADRRRHRVKGGISVMPHDQVTLGLSGIYSDSDYHNTVFGLTEMKSTSVIADASFMPASNIDLSAFVGWDRAKYTDDGYQRGSAAITPSTTLNPDLFWQQVATDKGLTTGVEAEWTAIEDLLTFAADYTYSRTRTDFDFNHGVGVVSSPLPTLKSSTHSFGVRGEFKVRDDVAIRLGYRFEDYDADDFALDSIGEDIPRVLTLGNESQDYTAHIVWTSLVVHF